MSFSSPARAWWASSDTRARGTAVGAVLLVLALGIVSAVVWNSPSAAPLREAIERTTQGSTLSSRLAAERDALLEQVDVLREGQRATEAELAAMEAEFAELQQQLWTAEGELQAVEAAARDRALQQAQQSAGSQQSSGSSGGGDASGGSGGQAAQPSPQPSQPVQEDAATITAPTKAEILAPDSAYLGLYTQQSPFDWSDYDDTAVAIGMQPNLVGYFGGWDQDFRADAVQRSWTREQLPVLTWESRPMAAANDVVDEPEYSLPRILAGEFDEYLRQYARDIVATGLPLGIRLDHEMNGTWYPWSEQTSRGESINGNSPGDYVAMWQYVHDIFEQEGANDQVVWIWSPNRIDRLPTAHQTPEYLEALYPGDEYVDWLGMSGYLRPPYDDGLPLDFSGTFGRTLEVLRGIADKPILLAEIGASETGDAKPEWITSLFTALEQPENADILGVIWFDMAVTTVSQGSLTTNDWRIQSRRTSLEAFSEGLAASTRFELEPRAGW